MRRAYLALCWPPACSDAVARVHALEARLGAESGWRRTAGWDGLSLWQPAGERLSVKSLPRSAGVIIGDLFPNPRDPLALAAALERPAQPVAFARRLVQAGWGRYVAVLADPAGGLPYAMRDPSGLVGCMTWSLRSGVEILASDMAHPPMGFGAHAPFLNWDAIARFVAAPAAAMTRPLFDDITVVQPGEVLRLGPGPRRSEAVWSAADFAANSHRDLEDAAREAVQRVEACTQALVGRYDRVLVELSGGLDSSILAGTLASVGCAPRVAAWLNYQDSRPEADESRYARAVTDRIGVDLTTPQGWAAPIDEASLAETARHAWPAIGGVDAGRDRDELARLTETGASAIVSGQGGDGAFFQFPTALVMSDALRRDGARALASPLLAAVARRTRQSVWGVLSQVRAERTGRARRPRMTSTLLSRAVAAVGETEAHPWVRAAQARGLPPAKVLHVQGVAVTHLYGGPSRRLQAADILLPLFAQPVIEHCLSIAVPDLAGESYDRPFARRAFRDRLPHEVLQRRTKGDMSTYYGKLAAISLDTLRPYLLDGCLAEAGLLDRDMLGRTLDAQHLMTGGGAAAMDVLNAAAVEAWVRYWQTRVPDSRDAVRWRWRG